MEKEEQILGGRTSTNFYEEELIVNNVLTKSPNDLKISTNIKGGLLLNIDKAAGDTAKTSSGFIEDEKYGVYAFQSAAGWSAEFDSNVKRTGKHTLKISTTSTAGRVEVIFGYNSTPANPGLIERLYKYAIPVKNSTKYKLSLYIKTNNAVGDYFQISQYGITGTRLAQTNTNYSSGTTDWTLYTSTITTNASAAFFVISIRNNTAGNVSDVWADLNSMTLDEILENTTYTGSISEKIRPTLQAITTTDNIDQSLDTAEAYPNTYALTNAINEGATHIQTFTPTKKYITRIAVWVAAKGSGNWTLTVHDAANNVRASETILNANLVDETFNYFNVPTIWTTGNYHFHVHSSVADGTAKANTTNDLETASYIQQYAKKSEGFSLIVNGVKTEIKADRDGFLSNSILDIDNSRYKFRSLSTDNLGLRLSNLFSYALPNILTNTGNIGDYGASGNAFTFKVNTILPIKGLCIKAQVAGAAGSEVMTMAISRDNITYVDLVASTAGVDDLLMADTTLVNGFGTFFLRFTQSGSNTTYISNISIDADIDTSNVNQGVVYPFSENKIVETVKLTNTVDRVYYRLNKYMNENGIVIPSIEYSNGTQVINFIPLKIDNSQETNPSIAIVKTETTNGQAVGTGTNSGDNYILNDGEYMTLSTATDELSVSYLVGQGTTSFGNITKNIFYLSSNADGSDGTQDQSHQANVVLGIKQQGLVDRVKDLGEMAQDVRSGLNNAKQTLKNNVLITGFDAGTTDDYAITLPEFNGYITGMTVIFRATTANTTGATLSINNYPARAIVKGVSTALATNDILASMFCYCVFDGTNFVLLNPRVL